jgi:hypothetical protein
VNEVAAVKPAAREERKGAEEIERPVERLDERDPEADHDGTERKRTQNTPEEHQVLVSRRHGEIRKDEDEDVINAE